jgi:thiopeptide-type bacteriocin biosynthesis protein
MTRPNSSGKGKRNSLIAAVAAFLDERGAAPTLELRPDERWLLSEGFVEAGNAWLACTQRTRRWLQINAALLPDEAVPGLTLVTGRLQDLVRDWLATGGLDDFHFIFKPPGARLRFKGPLRHLESRAAELCAMLIKDRAVQSATRGLYDCEPHQFGGAAGLKAAHRFFTAESMAVLRYWRLLANGEATMGAPEFSLALLDLFLRRTVDDVWELWDVWCRMDLAGRAIDPWDAERWGDLAGSGHSLVTRLHSRDPSLTWVPDPERACLLAFQEQAAAAAIEWRALRDGGRLLFPLREILPFLIVFHFNRMGFDSERQRQLCWLMQTLLSPKLSPLLSATPR